MAPIAAKKGKQNARFKTKRNNGSIDYNEDENRKSVLLTMPPLRTQHACFPDALKRPILEV
jgi:hypothetical protein